MVIPLLGSHSSLLVLPANKDGHPLLKWQGRTKKRRIVVGVVGEGFPCVGAGAVDRVGDLGQPVETIIGGRWSWFTERYPSHRMPNPLLHEIDKFLSAIWSYEYSSKYATSSSHQDILSKRSVHKMKRRRDQHTPERNEPYV
jgi:hypothetical protein